MILPPGGKGGPVDTVTDDALLRGSTVYAAISARRSYPLFRGAMGLIQRFLAPS
jgi:hypothetical protein